MQPAKDEIEQTGLFSTVKVTRYTWDIIYNASSYTRLLTTYSDHRALDSETRERLFRDITTLINTDYDGQVTKGYAAILYMAHQQS